jgi:hypothetical protein
MRSFPHQKRKTKNDATYLLIVMLALGMTECQEARDRTQPGESLSKTIVRYVDIDLESPIGVPCDSLESFWGDEVDTLVIIDRPFLDSLASIVSKLKPSNKGFSPDARMVVEMYFTRGIKKTLCMSNVALALDGKEMEFAPDLLRLLESRTTRSSQ